MRHKNPPHITRQSITSAATSRKQVARAFKLYGSMMGPIHLDTGAGKYDLAQKWMKKHYPRVRFYREDPYNLPASLSQKAIKTVKRHGADSVTSNNVLNVIKEADARIEHIAIAAMMLKPKGLAIFQIYKGKPDERRRYPKGRQLGDTWQHFKPASFYTPMIRKAFKQVGVVGDFIFARGPKV